MAFKKERGKYALVIEVPGDGKDGTSPGIWVTKTFNMGAVMNKIFENVCPHCGSDHIVPIDYSFTDKVIYQCENCRLEFSLINEGNNRQIVTSSLRYK